MATRQDIHKPSAVIPAEYQFVGLEVARNAGLFFMGAATQERAIILAHMARTGGTYSSHEHKGNCMCCSARCIYTALFYHASSNVYIRTGLTCAEKLSMSDPARFRRFKEAVDAARFHLRGKKKAQGLLEKAGLDNCWTVYQLLTDLPEGLKALGFNSETPLPILADYAEEMGLEQAMVIKALSTPGTGGSRTGVEATIADVVGNIVRWGNMSQKQEKFLHALLRQLEERPEVEQARKEEKARANPVPEGKWEGMVEVIKTEWREERPYQHSRGGSTRRMVMTCKALDGGFLLWGTVPVNCQVVYLDGRGSMEGTTVQEQEARPQRELGKGDKFKLSATLKRSDRDEKFGFFSYPTGTPTGEGK